MCPKHPERERKGLFPLSFEAFKNQKRSCYDDKLKKNYIFSLRKQHQVHSALTVTYQVTYQDDGDLVKAWARVELRAEIRVTFTPKSVPTF